MPCVVLALVALVATLFASVAGAAPPPRPLAGKGVVMIPLTPNGSNPLPVYESPGVRRLTELPVSKLPAITVTAEEATIPVLAEKDQWLKVVYDEAGREGWISRTRSWQVLPWTETFKSRFAKMYAGLKPPFYVLRKTPDDKGEQVAVVPARKPFRILVVQGSWGQALLDFTYVGWIKWRDEDGRLLVGVE